MAVPFFGKMYRKQAVPDCNFLYNAYFLNSLLTEISLLYTVTV